MKRLLIVISFLPYLVFSQTSNENLKVNTEQSVTKITKSDPTSDEFLRMGNIKSAHKDYKGAIIDFTKAIEINPGFSLGYSNLGGLKFKIDDKQGGSS